MTTTTEAPKGAACYAGRDTDPKQLASSIAICIREYGYATVTAVGPHALNNAIKALAIAREYLRPERWDLTLQPSFVRIPNRDRPGELTAMLLTAMRITA